MRSLAADVARAFVEVISIKVWRFLERLEDSINRINDWEVSK